MRPITDEELMLKAQRGDLMGFSMLFDRYRDSLSQYVRFRLPNLRNVESICDEVFFRARRSAFTYRYPQKFSTWLFTIAFQATKQ